MLCLKSVHRPLGRKQCFYPFLISKPKKRGNKMANNNEVIENTDSPLLIDEFEIIELEDRLELAGRCNGRCDTTAA